MRGLRDLVESVCVECTLARYSREIDKLQNKQLPSLTTDDDCATSRKKSKLDIEGKTGGEDDHEDSIADNDYENSVDEVADEKNNDSLDVRTHFTNDFPSKNGMKKNDLYIFPEEPNELIDRLGCLIDLQKLGNLSRIIGISSFIDEMKNRIIREYPLNSGTVGTCETPEATQPGIEIGSSKWEVSSLGTTTQRPLLLRIAVFNIGEIWAALNIEVLRVNDVEVRRLYSSVRMKGWGKRDIPEKTRRPVVSSGKIPTCKDTGVTPPGTEHGAVDLVTMLVVDLDIIPMTLISENREKSHSIQLSFTTWPHQGTIPTNATN
ncbi:hypothetical protein PR048_013618 [Dryococelus australis]|uniref:Uncharacterized protein n=1 Tax=Dryococelus australis TaxID=614101 RepID=A0ABQ9HSP5_9NEOP|nr:hypothetical protein PR048_013618 [Dryococelus australis]